MDAEFLLNSSGAGPRLRIGLLMNGIKAPRWVAEVIGQILDSNFASIQIVVLNSAAAAPQHVKKSSRARRALELLVNPDRRRNLIVGLYQHWDHRNVSATDNPLEPVDCSELLAGVRVITVNPVTSRFVHRFEEKDLQVIRGENLDVLIRFGFNILRGDILSAARHGVWSYHHGDNEFYRGGPAYLWELVEENPCSGAVLQVLSERLDDGKVLCKGNFATELGISQVRNCIRPYWGACTFMIQKLRELHQHGWDHVESHVVAPTPYRGRKEIYRAPTNGEMMLWLGRRVARAALRRLRRRPQVLHWRLGIRTTDRPLVEDGVGADLDSFHWIDSPRGHYYADPFIVQADGRRWVFFEDYDFAGQIGSIRCAELCGQDIVDYGEVLRRPYHLSYPCVFQDGEAWYMIPETAGSGCVELYAARRFPDDWQYVGNILKANAVDSTIWRDGETFWLFVTRIEPRGNASQLWLYSSQSLSGPWAPHPANPLSTDVRLSRGGGAIFRRGGRLYRPSQDGTIRYGRRIILNEILVLTPLSYRERVVVEIGPGDADRLLGVHSYALLGDIEIIDGLTAVGAGEV